MRTSPAEPASSGGSESGGSGVESIGGTSGRSSTYGDQIVAHSSSSVRPISRPVFGNSSSNETHPTHQESTTSTVNTQEPDDVREEDADDANEAETIQRLHVLR